MSVIEKISSLVDLFDFLPLSNRNLIVDGNFDQWTASSAALSSSALYVSAMMYRATCGAGGAGTLALQSFAPGAQASGMDQRALVYAQFSQTTASTGTLAASSLPCLFQNVENVATLGGQSATLSCWLWCASGTVQVSNVCARQSFGSGGSPSSQVNIDTAVNWTITTTPQKFSVRIDLPSISGKTLGTTANTNYLQIGLWLPAGVTFTLNTTQWQLEQCSPQAPATGRPTAFEYRGYQVEFARTERFYESCNAGCHAYSSSSGGFIGVTYTFQVAKRATPTVTRNGDIFITNTGTPYAQFPTLVSFEAIAQTSATGVCAFVTSYSADARL